MEEDLQSRVQVLLDKQDIFEGLMRYCRGVDRGDRDLIESAFHQDAIDNRGAAQIHSSAQIADSIVTGLTGATSMHFIGNVLIEVDGDTGFSEASFIAYLVLNRDGTEYLRSRAGRYVDRCERRDGVWRIATRVMVDDWSRIEPIAERVAASGRVGLRSSEDVGYQLRAGGPDFGRQEVTTT